MKAGSREGGKAGSRLYRAAVRLCVCAAVLAVLPSCRLAAQERPLGTLREQAVIQQSWLEFRLDSILPGLMRQHGVQMWIVDCREYNEDPVFFAIVSPTTFACRRRTIYVFHDRGRGQPLERLALGGSSQGGLFQAVRDSSANVQTAAVAGRGGELVGAGQWALLRRVIEARHPATIALDISQTHAFSDGLSFGEYEQLQAALGPSLMGRVRRAELLPLEYIAARPPAMEATYRRLQEVAWDIISRAFSREVITPGVTTTEDVVWWTRQRLSDLGLTTWFQTDVDIQRRGVDDPESLGPRPVIMPGDVLHIDFGVSAMGLKTDTQHLAYVVRPDESDAPAGLKAALANGNRLQDIVMTELRPGRTGNQILLASLAAMRAAGLTGTIYSHPIGDHGHGAGPLIGLWDRQEGVPGRGDAPVIPNTWFSVELEARTPVAEWGGQMVKMAQEEDAVVAADGRTHWALRRQTDFHLVTP
jgi:hypothetical protein